MSGLADAILALGSPSLEARLQADVALAGWGSEADEALIALLTDRHAPEEAQWRAAFTLGRRGTAAALPALLTGLASQHWSVRHACACALGEIGDAGGAQALLAIATAAEPDEQTNYVAAIGLLRLQRSQGEAVLRAVAAGGNRAGRNTAVSALAVVAY
ncbi:MAG: HEAT repeat domain-containing protein [Anaerolineae bacterium]|nr:HEAT repeat domain-containing protein [Anaerolineae bacterium]